jgi:23S rRNA (guanosine2251-2'-O)-methyltransferase
MTAPLVIILGSEETGIDVALLKIADEWTKIPQLGTIQSLNVSVAAGILMFEAVRQRILAS